MHVPLGCPCSRGSTQGTRCDSAVSEAQPSAKLRPYANGESGTRLDSTRSLNSVLRLFGSTLEILRRALVRTRRSPDQSVCHPIWGPLRPQYFVVGQFVADHVFHCDCVLRFFLLEFIQHCEQRFYYWIHQYCGDVIQ